ncbi:MAG: septal ring lytic transglycosylase RlpA family protein [Terracidiphilus sp.]
MGAALAALGCLMLAGCGHRRQAASAAQTAPPLAQPYEPGTPAPEATEPGTAETSRIPITRTPAGGIDGRDIEYVNRHRPIESEVGYATWYTAARGRRSANGQVFSNRALTAAHRTLPMGSLIVVTNLKTGQRSAMRITDRGPFVEGRILDLTIASAKATGVYQMGLAEVRVDVYKTPKPIDSGGRWCVQIGAFKSERKALKLKKQLERRYPDANVIEFPGEESYWVRIRPEGDNREQAESIVARLRPAEGEAFLTRLD